MKNNGEKTIIISFTIFTSLNVTVSKIEDKICADCCEKCEYIVAIEVYDARYALWEAGKLALLRHFLKIQDAIEVSVRSALKSSLYSLNLFIFYHN